MDDEKWIAVGYLNPFRVKMESFKEWMSGVLCRNCYVCQHFIPGIGSSGFCKKSNGCVVVCMRDVFDTCDCGAFKPIMPWRTGRDTEKENYRH